MSTLWFDVMNLEYDDPDWSTLPETDKSSCLEDDYSENSFPELKPESEGWIYHEKSREKPANHRTTTQRNKFRWLLPPTEI